MTNERPVTVNIPVIAELTQREQFSVVKGLMDIDPHERLSVLSTVLDADTTRIRTLGMSVLGQTAEDLPDEVLSLAERGVRDKNDRVSAAAIKALGASTTTAPEKALPSLDYAFTRRALVREAAATLVVRLFESDQASGLPFLIKMAEDKPNSWRNSDHIEKIICDKPELFDLNNASPSTEDDLARNQWRKLLERQLVTYGHSALKIANSLITERPELALNVLVLAEKIKELQPVDTHLSGREKQSQIGLFLTSRFWGGNSAEHVQQYYDLIQANPETRAYLDQDIAWVKSDEYDRARYGAGASWLHACKAIPELKERLAVFFADRTRRLSDTSEEYVADRERVKAWGGQPEIFGFGAVDVPGIETPQAEYFTSLQHYKYRVEHILNEDNIQRHVSQATLAKAHYLKSLFANGDTEEINDERFINFLKCHIDEQMITYRESVARTSEWQERFLARLPEGVDRDLAQRRIAETRVVFFDELSAITSWHNQDAGGTFEDKSSIARIDLSQSPINQEKIYTHELLHALSGRSLVFHPLGLTQNQMIVNQRVGFHITPVTKDGFVAHNGTSRFRWLNEAVTEDITQEMMWRDGYASYHQERELLHLLRTSGKFEISNDVVRNAYFENFDTDLPAGERLPHWKELQKQLREAHGEPMLVKLDNIVRKQGIHVAISELYKKQNRTQRSYMRGFLLFNNS